MLRTDDFTGKTFLDIGSGSGHSSLVTRRMGARVTSFDYDPSSVGCTQELRRRYFPSYPDWREVLLLGVARPSLGVQREHPLVDLKTLCCGPGLATESAPPLPRLPEEPRHERLAGLARLAGRGSIRSGQARGPAGLVPHPGVRARAPEDRGWVGGVQRSGVRAGAIGVTRQ